MDILLENISKRYIHEWVFKDISESIENESKWAIVGPNGSGKSTLLQIISAFRLPSSGQLIFRDNGQDIPPEAIYEKVSFASPYIELIEEFTLKEQLEFHYTWRDNREDNEEIISLFNLGKAINKQIKYFSSGMKQRLKLALAFNTESEVVLLDEPTANLDADGISVYHECLNKKLGKRTLIIASNDPAEYEVCKNFINIADYK